MTKHGITWRDVREHTKRDASIYARVSRALTAAGHAPSAFDAGCAHARMTALAALDRELAQLEIFDARTEALEPLRALVSGLEAEGDARK
jgi:hypothetical protein